MTERRIAEVRGLLQAALELELFTIPPYLTALYSIREGTNTESAQIIQGVVMEEMLHMALVANVLNAIGGRPCLSPDCTGGGSEVVRRRYPSAVPHVDLGLNVSLQRFCPDAIRAFQKIEEPEIWERPDDAHFGSIGQFYEYLLDRLIAACAELGEANVFTGDPERQIQRDEYYYGAGGCVLPVYKLADAKDVLGQVAQQGEGRRASNLTGDSERFGQPKEVAHYYRFEQILAGRYYDRDDDVALSPSGPELRVDWDAVHPMRANPELTTVDPEGMEALLADFEARYEALLCHIHRGFNGERSALAYAIGEMHGLRHLSTALMKIDCGGGATHGAPFWYLCSK